MKNRRKFAIIVCAALILSVIFGTVGVFADEAPQSKNGLSKLEDLNGKRLGVQTGVLYEDLIKDELKDEEWFYYKMPNDMLPALESNKIDAYLIEEVGYYAQRYQHPEIMRMEESPGYCDFAVIVGNNEKQDRLYAEIQEYIAARKADGWLDQLYDYWVKNWNPETCKIKEIPETTGENGTVIIAIEGGYEPFSFETNGQFSGYDVEFMMNFCAAYGYQWDFQAMEFESIAPGAIAGKYDFGMNIVVDEERAENSVLSDPYYRCDIVFVLESAQGDDTGIIAKLQNSFNKTFIKDNRWRLFVSGIGTTLFITLASLIFGTLLGFAVYMACRNGNRVANKLTDIVCFFVDGIPTVVFLMILAFIVFANSHLSGAWISVLGFTLIFGCGMYDMLCVGCNAIPKGQYEAYSDSQSFFKIILPQAARHFLPIYKNDMVSLIKETSIVGYIAVMDLTKMGDLVRSRTYDPFFALIAVAIIYFVLEGLLTFAVSQVEKKVDTHKRSPESILRGIKEWEG